MNAGRWDDALYPAQVACECDRSYAPAWSTLARCYFGLGRTYEGKEACQAATQLTGFGYRPQGDLLLLARYGEGWRAWAWSNADLMAGKSGRMPAEGDVGAALVSVVELVGMTSRALTPLYYPAARLSQISLPIGFRRRCYALGRSLLERPMSPAYSPHPVHCHRSRSWAIAILLAASSLSCGDDDPLTPPLATPSAIVKIAGDDQAGRVSQVLPNPLVVQVLDQASNPVAGVSVTWEAQDGGSVSPETVSTDSDGLASADRVLGPTAGNQTTTAAVSELPGIPRATFTAIALVEE